MRGRVCIGTGCVMERYTEMLGHFIVAGCTAAGTLPVFLTGGKTVTADAVLFAYPSGGLFAAVYTESSAPDTEKGIPGREAAVSEVFCPEEGTRLLPEKIFPGGGTVTEKAEFFTDGSSTRPEPDRNPLPVVFADREDAARSMETRRKRKEKREKKEKENGGLL